MTCNTVHSLLRSLTSACTETVHINVCYRRCTVELRVLILSMPTPGNRTPITTVVREGVALKSSAYYVTVMLLS